MDESFQKNLGWQGAASSEFSRSSRSHSDFPPVCSALAAAGLIGPQLSDKNATESKTVRSIRLVGLRLTPPIDVIVIQTLNLLEIPFQQFDQVIPVLDLIFFESQILLDDQPADIFFAARIGDLFAGVRSRGVAEQ